MHLCSWLKVFTNHLPFSTLLTYKVQEHLRFSTWSSEMTLLPLLLSPTDFFFCLFLLCNTIHKRFPLNISVQSWYCAKTVGLHPSIIILCQHYVSSNFNCVFLDPFFHFLSICKLFRDMKVMHNTNCLLSFPKFIPSKTLLIISNVTFKWIKI